LPFPDYILSNNLISISEQVDESECDNNTCFLNRVKELIENNSSIEHIFFVIEDYKKYLNNDDVFNDYLYELYTLYINKESLSKALLDGLVIRSPTASIVSKILNNYQLKSFDKRENINLVNHFGSLFVYDESKELTKFEIENINKANEIIINILKSSYDWELVLSAANSANMMMNKKHADSLIQEAYERLYSSLKFKKSLYKNRFLYEIFNNKLNHSIQAEEDVLSHKELMLILKFNNTNHFTPTNKQLLLDYLYTIRPLNHFQGLKNQEYMNALRENFLWLSVIGKLGGQELLKKEVNKFDLKTRRYFISLNKNI
jgi:hypothetical protein